MTFIEVVVGAVPSNEADLALYPEINCITGMREFTASFGQPTSLERDLLVLAASVYCADLATKRGDREDFVRDFRLRVPIVNYHLLEPMKDDLQIILWTLSGDNWTIEFRPLDGPLEQWQNLANSDGEVLLFSGGLDSLAAAYQRLTVGIRRLVLVSHLTSNSVTRNSQEMLNAELEKEFPNNVTREHFYVSGRKRGNTFFPQDSEREETQRSRSFMFLILGALVARRKGISRVLMIAENGQMAIHLPLTQARIGAFSTRTAHPDFLTRMQQFLRGVLGFGITIYNPFLYRTKAEIVKQLVLEAPGMIPLSGSCWRAFRLGGESKHCGECIPCIIRRIALEYNQFALPEYKRDLFSEEVANLAENDTGKRNLSELMEFAHHFSDPELRKSVLEDFPELLSDAIDVTRAIEMYSRFATEAKSVFERYTGVRSLWP